MLHNFERPWNTWVLFVLVVLFWLSVTAVQAMFFVFFYWRVVFLFLLIFRGTVRSNGVPGVRFNLLLVLVAFFTWSLGKPSVMGLTIICIKAATVACLLGVAPYNLLTRKWSVLFSGDPQTEEKSIPVPPLEDLRSGSGSGMGMAGGISLAILVIVLLLVIAICACLLCKWVGGKFPDLCIKCF